MYSLKEAHQGTERTIQATNVKKLRWATLSKELFVKDGKTPGQLDVVDLENNDSVKQRCLER